MHRKLLLAVALLAIAPTARAQAAAAPDSAGVRRAARDDLGCVYPGGTTKFVRRVRPRRSELAERRVARDRGGLTILPDVPANLELQFVLRNPGQPATQQPHDGEADHLVAHHAPTALAYVQ